MRLRYLKEHRSILYPDLLTSDELQEHLAEVEDAAQNQMELLFRQMAKAQGVTKKRKADRQMEWVGRINHIRNSAEEIIREELIYA